MILEKSLLNHSELGLVHTHLRRDYTTFRERTEREFGTRLADQAEMAVAAIFEVVVQKMAGQFDRSDAVRVFREHGWLTSTSSRLSNRFAEYHDIAQAPQPGSPIGHSQFENAYFLESLNAKYFGKTDDRTTIFTKSDFSGALLAISDLGDPPQKSFAFGLKAVLPSCADYMLWWAIRRSVLWSYFAEPTDLGASSWSVFAAPSSVDRTRPFAKGVLGTRDHRLGPSNSEERFYLAAFKVPNTDQKLEIRSGSYLAYHTL